MTQMFKEIAVIILFLVVLLIASMAHSEPVEQGKTTGTISATVLPEPPSVEIQTPVEYVPVCEQGHENDTCRHSWDDMHPWQVEPAAGGVK